jgi:hypothetical protein
MRRYERRRRALPLVISTCALLLLGAQASWAARGKNAPTRLRLRRPFDAKKQPLPNRAVVKINGNAHLNPTQYKDLRAATMDLLKRYPPDKHYFVGVGRDPAPIIAFLKNIGGDELAANITASSNQANQGASSAMGAYVKKLIPKAAHDGRKVVFVDATRSGRGLAFWVPLLKPHFPKAGGFATVAYAPRGYAQNVKGKSVINHVFDTSAYPEVDKYPWGSYEADVSEYPRHSPGYHQISQLRRRAGFDKFRGGLLQHMERDRDLDKFLASLGGRKGAPAKKPATRRKAPAKKRAAKKPAKPSTAKVAAVAQKPTRGQRWGISSPYVANLRALPRRKQLTVKRTVKGKQRSYKLLSPADYRAYSHVAQELMRRYSPDKNAVYVGVGRSATPIVALMESLDAKRSGYLPIDNAEELTTAHRAEIAKLVKSFLPKSKLRKGSTLVLYQRGDGKGLAKVKTRVREALKLAGYSVTVKAVALSETATPRGIDRIDITGKRALIALDGAAIKAVAPISRHHVGSHTPPKPGKMRSKYNKLRSSLAQFMQRDLGLEKFLSGQ